MLSTNTLESYILLFRHKRFTTLLCKNISALKYTCTLSVHNYCTLWMLKKSQNCVKAAIAFVCTICKRRTFVCTFAIDNFCLHFCN